MALRRIDHDFFGPILGQVFALDEHSYPAVRHMAIDILEGDKQYEVKADIPGVAKQDIKLDVN